jgi:hypothetical protein
LQNVLQRSVEPGANTGRPYKDAIDPIRTSGGNDFASETRDICRIKCFQEKLFFKNYKTDGTFRPGANIR